MVGSGSCDDGGFLVGFRQVTIQKSAKNSDFSRFGDVAELAQGTPLLREHTGINLYRGFESLRLRQ